MGRSATPGMPLALAGFVDQTHFFCMRCGVVQPLVIEPLMERELGLGLQGRCNACAYVAFTMVKPARLYCACCDDMQPGVVKGMGGGDAHVLLCGVCLDAKATVYDMKHAKPHT
jgi:hypothetical protein